MGQRREFSLEAVRADGWFERVGEGNPHFDQLCSLVGERPLAFSIIAGVQITSVMVDRRTPDASLVDFVVGDDPTEHQMPLGEFRRRVTLALLGEESARIPLSEEPDTAELQSFLGPRVVLLAPLFGLRLEHLIVEDERHATVIVGVGSTRQSIALDSLVDLLESRLRRELEHSGGHGSAIDLAKLDEAEALSVAGDWDATIEILGSWASPLSVLLRTAEGARLAPEIRGRLARAMGLLGTAYARKAKYEYAEEVMRLGIQWGQDGPASGDIFRRLGETALGRGREGEAIGFLRRALALGVPPRDVLPALSEAFASRGRWVAAMVSADEAVGAGVNEDVVRPVREKATAALGEAWSLFRDRVPMTRAAAPTLRPPPRTE